MKQIFKKRFNLIAFAVIIAAVAYAIHYFNYMATPTEDFITNFRQKVMDIYAGNYPGGSFTIMPVFPYMLAFLTKINPFRFSHDAIYDTAILLNMILYIPYIILIYYIFRKFLERRFAAAALLFLSVNINSAYTAVNAELEMFMTLLIVLAIFLTIRESKFSYIPAFFATGIKYDSVFIIPAIMFRDFFYKRQRIITLILGTLSCTGVGLWVLLSFKYGNSYVSEIASRGPNIYMFPIDVILTAGGFIQWMAMHGYETAAYYIKISFYVISAISVLFVLTFLVRGIIYIIRQRWKEAVPIIIFFSGFMLIHMIYQNTKTRYVLPILSFLYLFMFYGLSTFSLFDAKNKLIKKIAQCSQSIVRVLAVTAGLIFVILAGSILFNLSVTLFIFTVIFTGLFGFIVFIDSKKENLWRNMLLTSAGGIIIFLSLFYGVRSMDHYSYRRVEFKEAALWYAAHSDKNDRMLISITDVPMYYSGLPAERFIGAVQLKSNTLEELITELRNEKATYVFVDDFYIRRYKIKDPNSIQKKAWLFQAVRDKGESSKHFKLLTSFEPRNGIKSYMFRFIP